MEVVQREAGDKPSLRLKILKRHVRSSAKAMAATSSSFWKHISKRLIRDLAEPGLQICLYRPLADEPRFALTPEREFFYPRLEGEDLTFLRPHGPFVKNRFGIEEPEPSVSKELDLSQPMLVFCPAVAVDTRGSRLGMGKGFYDRFFKRNPVAIRAAVVYQVQVSTDPLLADSWDQPMDWIVTETMILRTLRRST